MVVRDKTSKAVQVTEAIGDLQSAFKSGFFHVPADRLKGLNGHSANGPESVRNIHYWKEQIDEAVYLASARFDDDDFDGKSDWLRRRNAFFKRQAVSPFRRCHEEAVIRRLNGIPLH